jgi:hypothetical protein
MNMKNRKSSLLVALISSLLLAAWAPFACAQTEIGPPPPPPVFFQQAELQTGGEANPVAISADGSTVVVASGEFVNVFLNHSGVWTLTAQLTDSASREAFGGSVAINSDGSTIVVGAPFADAAPGCALGGGAAYVFVMPPGGWISTSNYAAKLTNSDGVEFDFLGDAVAISGDGTTVVVGAPKEHPLFRCDGTHLPLSPGSAYLYLKPSDGWGSLSHLFEVAELTSSDGADQDRFGHAVAVSGDGNRITVGAYLHNFVMGEAYVFVRPDDPRGWAANTRPTETSRLIAFDGVPGDEFGWSVATNQDGSTVAVGATGRNSVQGQAYVFVEPVGGWAADFQPRAVGQLGSTNGSPCDEFGAALVVSGDGNMVVVGTDLEHATVSLPNCADAFGGQGAVYVFTKPRDGWSLLFGPPAAKLVPADAFNNTLFGRSVATSQLADKIVVGEVNSGVAYIFAQGPLAALSSSSLSFNSQPVGTTSGPQTVTLTNNGSQPLTVTVVGITPGFHTSTNCLLASPIAPGASCSESVTFAPMSTGLINGTLSFGDDSGNVAGTEQTVSLAGTGIAPATTTTITSVVLNPSVVGLTVTVSFNVAAVGQNAFTPSGTSIVSSTSGESCTGSVPAGSCALTFAIYGPRTLTAFYAGDGTFSGSTSSGVIENVGDFAIGASPGGLTIPVGASGASKITIGSLGGFSFPVSLTVTGAPAGVSATFLPISVTPLGGDSASSMLTVSLGPSVTPKTFLLTASAAYGSLTRSTPLSVSIVATPASTSNVISQILKAGCIDNAGIANALTSKLAAAQAYMSAGDTQEAIDVLNALLHQVQAQSGKHILTSCTIGGVSFNPVAALHNDVQSIVSTLGP